MLKGKNIIYRKVAISRRKCKIYARKTCINFLFFVLKKAKRCVTLKLGINKFIRKKQTQDKDLINIGENFMEKNSNKSANNRLLLWILVILLLALGALAASFAWTKYINSSVKNATVQIAKFHFELKNLNNESSATVQSGVVNFPFTRTDNNTNVANGIIGPNTYGVIEMIIDSTDTEVSYRYDLNLTINNCPTNLKFYRDSAYTDEIDAVRTSQTENDVTTKVTTILISKFVPVAEADAEHTEYVYWKWNYETGADTAQVNSNDIIDTADMNKEVTMQIAATGTQMISYQYQTSTIAFNSNGGTGSMSNQSINVGATNQINKNEFTRENYIFLNWNTSPDGSGTTYYDEQSVSNIGNITLYAQWWRSQNEIEVPQDYQANYFIGEVADSDGTNIESYNVYWGNNDDPDEQSSQDLREMFDSVYNALADAGDHYEEIFNNEDISSEMAENSAPMDIIGIELADNQIYKEPLNAEIKYLGDVPSYVVVYDENGEYYLADLVFDGDNNIIVKLKSSPCVIIIMQNRS